MVVQFLIVTNCTDSFPLFLLLMIPFRTSVSSPCSCSGLPRRQYPFCILSSLPVLYTLVTPPPPWWRHWLYRSKTTACNAPFFLFSLFIPLYLLSFFPSYSSSTLFHKITTPCLTVYDTSKAPLCLWRQWQPCFPSPLFFFLSLFCCIVPPFLSNPNSNHFGW